MATLAQALDDHLRDCLAQRQAADRRMGRVEALQWSAAGALILQLLAVCFYLLTHPGGVGH